jgi:hypothetical protein
MPRYTRSPYVAVTSIIFCIVMIVIIGTSIFNFTNETNITETILSFISSLICLTTLVYGLYRMKRGRLEQPLASVLWLTGAPLILAIAIFVFGLIGSIVGMTCTGLFGTQTSCSGDSILSVAGLFMYAARLLWVFAAYCAVILVLELVVASSKKI